MPSSYIRPNSNQGKTKKFIDTVEDERQAYSDHASDYTLGSIIGFGSSSIVYSALYHIPAELNAPNLLPTPIPCALKVIDLDSLGSHSLSLLQRETTVMSLLKHPNVIRVRGSWMDGHKLYIATRLMNSGSVADIMRYGWPGGMEEEVIKCILRQALQGLNYLHINGFIHRDIKAANLLIDDDGTVLLGDLGVAADLAEESSFIRHADTAGSKQRSITTASADLTSTHEQNPAGKRVVHIDSPMSQRPKIRKRKSFVGTPCWMAPELIQGQQYDTSVDIWSFGITAVELTRGRPPRSRESTQKVLTKIIQEDPVKLDREGGRFRYSSAFKEIVDGCLVKDPSKRPTAEELLESPFFKSAKKPSYLVRTILKDLPPLAQRQERRPLPLARTRYTVDSWDFATTVRSPIFPDESEQSCRLGSAGDVDVQDIEQHDDHSSISRCRCTEAVSWHDDNALGEKSEEDAKLLASASSLPSDPILSKSEVPTNSDTSTLPSSTSMRRKQLAKPSSKTTLIPTSTRPPASFPAPMPSPRLNLRPSGSESQVSTSLQLDPSAPPSSSTRLWRKLKSADNYRRPSSRGGPGLSLAPGESSPEKLGLGSRFAKKVSAGKHALAGATTHTAQAVGKSSRMIHLSTD